MTGAHKLTTANCLVQDIVTGSHTTSVRTQRDLFAEFDILNLYHPVIWCVCKSQVCSHTVDRRVVQDVSMVSNLCGLSPVKDGEDHLAVHVSPLQSTWPG